MTHRVIFSILLLLIGVTSCSLKQDSKVQHLTYQSFTEKIWDIDKQPDSFAFKGNTAVIVDFYAKWCGPCVQLLPIMEKMANEYEGDLTIYKVDVDKEKDLATAFKIQGLPAMLCFSSTGSHVRRYNGLPSEADLRTIIEEELLDKPTQP
jgi:thioredoxin